MKLPFQRKPWPLLEDRINTHTAGKSDKVTT